MARSEGGAQNGRPNAALRRRGVRIEAAGRLGRYLAAEAVILLKGIECLARPRHCLDCGARRHNRAGA